MNAESTMHTFDHRPAFSRQRSNSVPALFSLFNVSDEEASVIFSAAERATARRRRHVSVDSPGPIINNTQAQEHVPSRNFHFSTPSRFAIGRSPLSNVVRSASLDQAFEFRQEEVENVRSEQEEDEETPSYEVEPAPIPQQEIISSACIVDVRQTLSSACVVDVRSPSSCSTTSSQDPTSPRRKVATGNLIAYADGLLLFTQSRLNTVAPQTLYISGQSSDSPVPPTPELEQDILELPMERPTLRSHFSNWSSTTEDTEDDEIDSRQFSFASSMEPRTPDEESGMISPDSFFNEATPRVRQTTEWTSISSARPSSRISLSNVLDSYMSSNSSTINDPNSESFSYFAGFDSVSAIASSGRASPFDFEVLQTPPTPLGMPSRSTRERPASSASNPTPFSRRQTQTPLSEGMGISRPPSWLVRAVG